MSFVGDIFSQLKTAAEKKVLLEIRDGQVAGVTGGEFLELIRRARTFLASKGLKKGDRCGLLAANSIRWVAIDLAAMAEGLIVVPLYFRQAPAELVAMIKDSAPSLMGYSRAGRRTGRLHLHIFFLTRFLPVSMGSL
jgi:long-subunit acyl-CoA synthetase (AMP-forming)